jgi:hypothetical protein
MKDTGMCSYGMWIDIAGKRGAKKRVRTLFNDYGCKKFTFMQLVKAHVAKSSLQWNLFYDYVAISGARSHKFSLMVVLYAFSTCLIAFVHI